MTWLKKPTEDDPVGTTPSDFNTLVLNLDVECKWHERGIERAKRGETEPKRLYQNSNGKSIAVSSYDGAEILHFSVCEYDHLSTSRSSRRLLPFPRRRD
jgi:hypothetical protein